MQQPKLSPNLHLMHRNLLFSLVSLCCLAFLQACSPAKPVAPQEPVTSQQAPPAPGAKAESEFRAAWVATVANINWPSKPGLSTQEQQREAIELLDFLQQHHYNAVIFQVRPQADALYKSDLEPWSYYLTGEQGKAPDPFYDPLEFWTEAAHDRGLELHVWLNPYRAHHVAGGPVSEQSIVKKHPELVVQLKEGYYWLDPAQKGTQDHSYNVVMDLVKRYDIDGVHFDDYFYPYPSYNGDQDFPDEVSWAAYQKSGGTLSRGDWRRQAVNQFIERLYAGIKAEKAHVKFGLSPFGIWRPGYPASVQGFDQHNVLFADARLWLNKGWIDYFAPQLYWKINQMNQSFPVLLGWWAQENTMKRHLWPGISVGRDSSALNVQEIMSQIMVSRGMLPDSKGVIHWSLSSVTKNPPMAKALLAGPYKNDALVPTSPWLDQQAPATPSVSTELQGDSVRVVWVPKEAKDAFRTVVYYQYGNAWNYKVLNRNDRSFTLLRSLPNKAGQALPLKKVAVTSVDRMGNESDRQEATLPEVSL
ncbi:glycoside hydrolase family 10 protein [Rufibacter soli]